MKHTMRKSFLLSLVLIFLGNYAMADAIPSKIKARLDVVVPGYDASSVKPSAVPGLYEFVGSGRVLYISEDGRYIVNGNVIDMEGQQNLTEQSQRKVTIKLINGYDEKKMITFSPEGKPKHIITVFTDVDCPYCSMLHKEVPKLNDAGIEVRYLMYPRAGEGSPTYHKSVSAWCNDDQQKAISVAKEGGVVARKTCDDPVKEQFELGKLIGVTGTPTLILENGKILPGFVPAAQLIKIIDDQA